jgi:hypothetical protein
MKRNDYKKPSMKVIELRQRCQILAGSNGVTSVRSGYTSADSQTWGEDEPESGN